MARLTEEMVIARSKQSDLYAIKNLNCWGAELSDVSLLRELPNVEVLAFSVNHIRSLSAFSACSRLRELYVRQNDIRDLTEIRHLRALPQLVNLWLEENPCADHPEYRLTVLRNLPQLQKLDNVPVQQHELEDAMRHGAYIPDSDDEEYCAQAEESYREPQPPSPTPQPDVYYRQETHQSNGDEDVEHSEESVGHEQESPRRRVSCGGRARSPEEERSHAPPPALVRSFMDRSSSARGEGREARGDTMRHSYSAQSVKDYSTSNGDCRGHHSPHERDDRYSRQETYQQVPQRCAADPVMRRVVDAGEQPSTDGGWQRGRTRASDAGSERGYSSAVMAECERPGFRRRPVTRNSNLLSAVLCLVKELDYHSLEVTEIAVRCRMDELANSQ